MVAVVVGSGFLFFLCAWVGLGLGRVVRAGTGTGTGLYHGVRGRRRRLAAGGGVRRAGQTG